MIYISNFTLLNCFFQHHFIAILYNLHTLILYPYFNLFIDHHLQLYLIIIITSYQLFIYIVILNLKDHPFHSILFLYHLFLFLIIHILLVIIHVHLPYLKGLLILIIIFIVHSFKIIIFLYLLPKILFFYQVPDLNHLHYFFIIFNFDFFNRHKILLLVLFINYYLNLTYVIEYVWTQGIPATRYIGK